MATFEDVQRAERKELQGVRERAPDARLPDKTVGLAFSGGGIRSATFHLGVLQELAEHGLLKQVDYLSTVSGGGYIGSWLARWIREQGMAKVEEALPSDAQEAPEVNFLRDYSNYLTPRVGLLGADTWAAIALYLRNLLLNQAVLITFLSGILVIPWIVSASFECLEYGYYDGAKLMVFSIVAAILLIIAIAYGVLNTSTCSGGEQRKFAQPKKVLLSVVAPLFGGAVLLSYALWSYPAEWTPFSSIVAGMTVYTAGHLAGWIAARIANAGNPSWAPQFSNVLWALPAGFFAGYEVYALSFIVYRWKANPNYALGVWHAVSWGAPLIVLAFLLAGTLHIGLAKFALRNQMQEWWARLGGWLMLWALFWCALFWSGSLHTLTGKSSAALCLGKTCGRGDLGGSQRIRGAARVGQEYLGQASGCAANDEISDKRSRSQGCTLCFRDGVAGSPGMRCGILRGRKRRHRLEHGQVPDLLVRGGIHNSHRDLPVSFLACRHQSILDESALQEPHHPLLPGSFQCKTAVTTLHGLRSR
jgi:patatin-like phospholipase